MADIDKALPNVENEIKVPGEEEIVEAQQERIDGHVVPEDIDVTDNLSPNLKFIIEIMEARLIPFSDTFDN